MHRATYLAGVLVSMSCATADGLNLSHAWML
jgi:hypothetical protein